MGATAPPPPEPPGCPHCGLPQDRYPTPHEGHWVLLEPAVGCLTCTAMRSAVR
ncbi:DUF6083 domain-containing protein [Streptomyces sp. NBC_01669]|uniref:DUF6083 domain-containing protein n=1 Tax=Streptomyces sp. NBC_01669 TaxID=2975909 RepID=UPI00224DA25B|nr:DUF6083 domain-containing protein [Streptomyces sp. NBC_01669]MCX4537994.1 DUF6083 domain-containing protein [Streptomyces sp. NBC_01669]